MTRLWPSLLGMARVVEPATILRWHRAGFRSYWRWKSRKRAGRPRIDRDLRDLIRRMSKENPLWGAPRIHGELLILGFELAESTVSTYMMRRRHPPSQSWRTFLRNHAEAIAAIDLCLVPTARFESLFALVVIGHGRQQLLWFAVTRHPTAEWLAQQIIEAFPWETAPAYLVRDNDGAYGPVFKRRVRAMGIRDPTDITAIALAEPICGTSDRNTPARLPGSRCHLRRAASASGPDRVFLLLQSDANAFVVVQGCAARSIDPARGSDCCCADFVGPASLLFADMIFRRDRWPRPIARPGPCRSGHWGAPRPHCNLSYSNPWPKAREAGEETGRPGRPLLPRGPNASYDHHQKSTACVIDRATIFSSPPAPPVHPQRPRAGYGVAAQSAQRSSLCWDRAGRWPEASQSGWHICSLR